MDMFVIEVEHQGNKDAYEIIDYAHDDDNRCKFEVFKDQKMIASFEPDSRGFLHICKNPGKVDSAILNILAEKIEAFNF